MSIFEINKSEFVGVWENVNISPFNYNDDVEITLHLTEILNTNIEIRTETDFQAYFSEDLEVIKNEDDKFTLLFKKSELNYEQDLAIKCRMYIPSKPKAFIANINNLGERYFEKK